MAASLEGAGTAAALMTSCTAAGCARCAERWCLYGTIPPAFGELEDPVVGCHAPPPFCTGVFSHVSVANCLGFADRCAVAIPIMTSQVCPRCQPQLRELHCVAHEALQDCYFTFLDHYAHTELSAQRVGLQRLIDATGPGGSRKKRRTMVKQLGRVDDRLDVLEAAAAASDGSDGDGARTAGIVKPWPKGGYCRTCYAPGTQCDGLCWGFWKDSSSSSSKMNGGEVDGGTGGGGRSKDPSSTTIVREQTGGQLLDDAADGMQIQVGDVVTRGPGWNRRYGEQDGGLGGIGVVEEVKGWASAGSLDAVKASVAMMHTSVPLLLLL